MMIDIPPTFHGSARNGHDMAVVNGVVMVWTCKTHEQACIVRCICHTYRADASDYYYSIGTFVYDGVAERWKRLLLLNGERFEIAGNENNISCARFRNIFVCICSRNVHACDGASASHEGNCAILTFHIKHIWYFMNFEKLIIFNYFLISLSILLQYFQIHISIEYRTSTATAHRHRSSLDDSETAQHWSIAKTKRFSNVSRSLVIFDQQN